MDEDVIDREMETEAAPAAISDPISETPEFQMELAKAKVELHDSLLDELTKRFAANAPAPVTGQSGGINDDTIVKLARAIALSNAEIADQGMNRKRVAPEILEHRRESGVLMHELLAKAQPLKGAERPRYRVKSKIYVGDRLVDPFQRLEGGKIRPVEVYFMSMPNLGMEPINETAKEIYRAFVGTISGGDSLWEKVAMPPDPLNAKPLYMTNNGAVVAKDFPSLNTRAHNYMEEPEAVDLDEVPFVGNGQNAGGAVEIMQMDDPRRTSISVLGTIAPPATRGSIDPRVR